MRQTAKILGERIALRAPCSGDAAAIFLKSALAGSCAFCDRPCISTARRRPICACPAAPEASGLLSVIFSCAPPLFGGRPRSAAVVWSRDQEADNRVPQDRLRWVKLRAKIASVVRGGNLSLRLAQMRRGVALQTEDAAQIKSAFPPGAWIMSTWGRTRRGRVSERRRWRWRCWDKQ